MKPTDRVTRWLLGGDPAIRWQVLRDLIGAAERTVEREPRWHYDILRALDYFQAVNAPCNRRLAEAIDIVRNKQGSDRLWSLQNRYMGKTYFELERVGWPSRWNTLRALRVLKWWERGRDARRLKRGGTADMEPARLSG